MILGGLLAFTRFCMAVNRPEEMSVSAHAATSITAPGAPAVAHSASVMASKSSELTPGGEQLLMPPGGVGCTLVRDPVVYCERPNVLRNVVQSSEVYRSVSSSTTMVCPWPVIPLVNRGLKS